MGEIKSVDERNELHQARLLTYLRLTGHRVGLPIDFDVVLFKQGMRRLVL